MNWLNSRRPFASSAKVLWIYWSSQDSPNILLDRLPFLEISNLIRILIYLTFFLGFQVSLRLFFFLFPSVKDVIHLIIRAVNILDVASIKENVIQNANVRLHFTDFFLLRKKRKSFKRRKQFAKKVLQFRYIICSWNIYFANKNDFFTSKISIFLRKKSIFSKQKKVSSWIFINF